LEIDNYFYGLIAIIIYWLLKLLEKTTSYFRKDFGWISLLFLFFLLNLIILIALSNVAEQFMNDLLEYLGLN
jgi:hypothetical protein